jgi:hypothetical protein
VISADLPIEDIRRCSRDAAFMSEVAAFFDSLDKIVTEHSPVCDNRGACCKFESYGHDLFVTSVELAYFLGHADGELLAPVDRSFCPYQQGGSCVTRVQRPVGCRIYFCEERSQHWQGDLTESALGELAKIGDKFKLQYAYLEWTTALRKLADRVVDAPLAKTNDGPVTLSIDSLPKRS